MRGMLVCDSFLSPLLFLVCEGSCENLVPVKFLFLDLRIARLATIVEVMKPHVDDASNFIQKSKHIHPKSGDIIQLLVVF